MKISPNMVPSALLFGVPLMQPNAVYHTTFRLGHQIVVRLVSKRTYQKGEDGIRHASDESLFLIQKMTYGKPRFGISMRQWLEVCLESNPQRPSRLL
jgi:hypothetical protein